MPATCNPKDIGARIRRRTIAARTAATLLALPIALVAHDVAASVAPSPACSAAKVVAAGKAMVCLAQEEKKTLNGRAGDPGRCTARLEADFAKAEAKASGSCPTSGDAATVVALVTNTQASVVTALMAGSAATTPQKTCVARKDLAAGNLARCLGSAGARRLAGRPDFRGRHTSEYAHCFNVMYRHFDTSESQGSCVTTGDELAIGDLVNPVGGYLPGAVFPEATGNVDFDTLYAAILRGADLRGARLSTELRNGFYSNANLSGAILTKARARNVAFDGADLSGATMNLADFTEDDFTGATLLGSNTAFSTFTSVVWSNTVCPDGTNSATNGSTPESCCGHFLAAPSTCSP